MLELCNDSLFFFNRSHYFAIDVFPYYLPYALCQLSAISIRVILINFFYKKKPFIFVDIYF